MLERQGKIRSEEIGDRGMERRRKGQKTGESEWGRRRYRKGRFKTSDLVQMSTL